jgi:hypothetical protein
LDSYLLVEAVLTAVGAMLSGSTSIMASPVFSNRTVVCCAAHKLTFTCDRRGAEAIGSVLLRCLGKKEIIVDMRLIPRNVRSAIDRLINSASMCFIACM